MEQERIIGYIYCITNKVNGKQYVGQTTQTIERRFIQHRSDARTGRRNSIIHNAIRKYGEENFTTEEIDSASSIDELCEKEIYWIAKLNTLTPNGYNLTEGGEGGDTWLLLPEDKKEKIRRDVSLRVSGKNNYWYGSSRKNELNPMYGRKHTEETKELIAEKATGRPVSQSTRKKHSTNNTGKGNPKARAIICLTNNKVYDTAKEASLELNVSRASISSICNNKMKECKGYTFMFYDLYIKDEAI